MRESGLPTLPLELLCALMATATVLVWAQAGVAATAALMLVTAVTVPLLRWIGTARTTGDERAAEVARLASDRDLPA